MYQCIETIIIKQYSVYYCTIMTYLAGRSITELTERNPCYTNPCQSISNADPSSCIAVSNDFLCTCEILYEWHHEAKLCVFGKYA